MTGSIGLLPTGRCGPAARSRPPKVGDRAVGRQRPQTREVREFAAMEPQHSLPESAMVPWATRRLPPAPRAVGRTGTHGTHERGYAVAFRQPVPAPVRASWPSPFTATRHGNGVRTRRSPIRSPCRPHVELREAALARRGCTANVGEGCRNYSTTPPGRLTLMRGLLCPPLSTARGRIPNAW